MLELIKLCELRNKWLQEGYSLNSPYNDPVNNKMGDVYTECAEELGDILGIVDEN